MLPLLYFKKSASCNNVDRRPPNPLYSSNKQWTAGQISRKYGRTALLNLQKIIIKKKSMGNAARMGFIIKLALV